MKDANNHDSIRPTQERAAVVAAYRQSGLGLKRFAREHGIHPGRLHYWVYQKHPAPKPRPSVQKLRADRPAVFQELKLQPSSGLLQGWAAEVSLARGLNVRFSGTASPDWIGAVVQALQRPC
jgi:transposase-like protein